MIRRPPSSNHTDTLCPCTTPFRSIRRAAASRDAASQHGWPWRAIELAMPRGADAPRRQVDVVIVHLGRRQGFGERRRARTWSEIARAAGLASEELHLRSREHRPSIADIGRSIDRKSTRLNPVTNAHLVCRILLE